MTSTTAQRAREVWAAGDYQRVGVRLVPASELLVADLAVRPGDRVLDVGGGTGNTALAAARRDADVVCTDIVPELLDHARRRAEVEGLAFDTETADAHELPFADGSFDVVASTFGVVFAADPERAAAELLRVLRPGGRLGLTAWIPGAPGGRLLELTARYDPDGAAGDPLRWGTVEGVLGLLGRGAVHQLRHVERTVEFTAPSLAAQWQRYRDWFGPVHLAWSRLDADGRRALEAEFTDMWGSYTRGSGPGIVVPNTYLQVTGVRAG
ncbi:methyltransferase domain-containing protein [Geodermatophilus sabuli]|uniref:Methyltransferase domain-containing protein n=1 Tax=Geodermatophilus sabuli TaxID=1564158 RepID=A0A7K3W280_9ACTN|nr:class I SAM-dependent methyltransferase [Geodermatophilus sabuli]NEK58902.1 methyltransferase domain-containing protein [Geodermatophilus sabuli]